MLVRLLWFGPVRQQKTKWLLCRLSPRWGGEENEKKKAKLMGQEKGSLTEQQRKRTVTTIILIKRIYKTREHTEQLSHCPMPSAVPISDPPLPRQPLLRT